MKKEKKNNFIEIMLISEQLNCSTLCKERLHFGIYFIFSTSTEMIVQFLRPLDLDSCNHNYFSRSFISYFHESSTVK